MELLCIVCCLSQLNVAHFVAGTASAFMFGQSLLGAQIALIQHSEGPINLTQSLIGGIETGNLIADF